eukprot:759928-Hanusia_phi.AAC.10
MLLYSNLIELRVPKLSAELKSRAYQKDSTDPEIREDFHSETFLRDKDWFTVFVYSQHLINSGRQREAESIYKKAIESFSLEVSQNNAFDLAPSSKTFFRPLTSLNSNANGSGTEKGIFRFACAFDQLGEDQQAFKLYSLAERLNVMDSNDKTNFAGFLNQKVVATYHAVSCILIAYSLEIL